MEFQDYIGDKFDYSEVSGGRQWKLSGACPFCEEERRDLRLYLDPDTGKGFCHHCGTGFGPIKFVAACEGISWKKAIKLLADDGDPYLKSDDDEPEPEVPQIFWPELVPLSAAQPGADYLLSRGMPPALWDHFRIHFCPSDTIFENRLMPTANRVVAPIYDVEGTAIAWQGRAIGSGFPKYFSPPNFKKAEVMVNAHAVPRGASYLIICEGFFDLFGWWRAGFTNVVAAFGKSISEMQADIIRYLKPQSIFVALDSDAIVKSYEFFERYGHIAPVRIVDLAGNDADEMQKPQLLSAIAGAQEYRWEDKILRLL